MKKSYDNDEHRLVFMNRKADAAYWDARWSSCSKAEFEKCLKTCDRFVLKTTNRYLQKKSRILEGGCGRGQNVYGLDQEGYDVCGVDFAAETVAQTKDIMPKLNLVVGDVRKLDFADQSFDAYWSLGVIEHFFHGYAAIMTEMHRVLKKGGYLFLTVPSLSLIRSIKARIGVYPKFDKRCASEDEFYQFAYAPSRVITTFSNNGFELVECKPIGGIKGLKDEISLLQAPLQWCYDGRSFAARVMRKFIDVAVRRFSNHMAFYVFRKV
jgi:SAM-dependent methyltransferase